MLGQMPGPGEIFLDHTAHFVPEVEPAAAALARCGFQLTPFTVQENQVGGARASAGTGNRLAMLGQGYVEILAAISDTPLARQLRDRLTRHVGLHLAAFSTADAAAEHRRLAAIGFSTQPIVDMRRPVAAAAGEVEARFTIARIAPGIMPEGRVQFLTHHTPDLVWRRPWLDHPNGAQALSGLWIAAADPGEPAARFARFTGRPARQGGDTATIALDRGTLRFASPEYLQHKFDIAPGPPPPYIAAYEIAVASLDDLSRFLASAGLAPRAVANGVVLDLPTELGGTIVFRALTG